MNNKIIKRIYIKGDYILTSPFLTGNGENENTDMDLQKNHEGLPFIPGTSIAGVLRNYLGGGCRESEEEGLTLPVTLLFGKRDKESTQSLLFVSDGRLKSDSWTINRRDGIRLDFDTRTTVKSAKYDYEIIEPGAVFEMRFEFICRKMYENKLINLKHCLYLIINAFENEKISIGAKTRRGLGKGKLENTQILDLDFNEPKTQNDMAKKWVEFDWDSMESNRSADDWKQDINLSVPYTDLKIEFKIPYSFLIRDYIAALIDSNNNSDNDSDPPDAVQLQCANKPVVPGSSWAGALRHHMKRICFNLLKDTGKFSALNILKLKNDIDDKIIHKLFGYVDEDNKTAWASRISFEESEIKNGVDLSYTRNKIDRFTGGTVDTALFTEKPVWGKPVQERNDTCVSLNIRIEQPLPEIDDYETGLLLLGINDMWHGIQPVGGGVSVGRGILAGQNISINSSEKKDIKNFIDNSKYMAALYVKMQEFITNNETASSRGDSDEQE